MVANYEKGDAVSKAFAEACDVCPECFRAGCRVLTGEKCRVTGKRQVQLKNKECYRIMRIPVSVSAGTVESCEAFSSK